jgi:hypothetical protein
MKAEIRSIFSISFVSSRRRATQKRRVGKYKRSMNQMKEWEPRNISQTLLGNDVNLWDYFIWGARKSTECRLKM